MDILGFTSKNQINNVFAIYAAVMIFVSIITVSIKIFMNKTNSEKRVEAMKGLLFVVLGVAIVSSGVFITQLVTTNLDNVMVDTAHPEGTNVIYSEDFAQSTSDPGWLMGTIIDMGQGFVNIVDDIRTSIIGEDLSLMEMILQGSTNPLMNMNVWLDGTGITYYALTTSFAFLILLYGVLRIGILTIKGAVNDTVRTEAKEQATLLIECLLLMIMLPTIVDLILDLTGTVLDGISNYTYNLGSSSFATFDGAAAGLVGITVQLYIMYLETKLWVILLLRMVLINVFYIFAPIAIALSGANKSFTSTTMWFNVMLKYLLLPVYYGFAIMIISKLRYVLPNGENPIVLIILLGSMFSIVNILQTLVQMRSVGGGGSGGNLNAGGAGMIAGAAMAMTAVMRMGKGNGGSPPSVSQGGGGSNTSTKAGFKQIGKALSNSKGGKAVSNNSKVQSAVAKIGQASARVASVASNASNSFGGQMAGGAFKVGKAVATSAPVRGVAGAAVGVGAAVITGNGGVGAALGMGTNQMMKPGRSKVSGSPDKLGSPKPSDSDRVFLKTPNNNPSSHKTAGSASIPSGIQGRVARPSYASSPNKRFNNNR
jgi:hypothetical protein